MKKRILFSTSPRWSAYSLALIRIVIGIRLVIGTLDNVTSWERMQEFGQFLLEYGFPIPLICAVVSVYVQFTAGILYVVGFKIRIAAFFLVLNFLVALLMIHLSSSYIEAFPALIILACSLYLIFYSGHHALSMDSWLTKRKSLPMLKAFLFKRH